MLHLPNPARYVFDSNPSAYHRLMERADAGEINLTEVIEARFLERWSYCGVDLKRADCEYVIAARAIVDGHVRSEVCADCLGAVNEARRLVGLPPLCDALTVGVKAG